MPMPMPMPMPMVMRPKAESAFGRAHKLEADVPMPFEHALVSLDDGRRLSRSRLALAWTRRIEEMTPSPVTK
jgi:hypothetical protein